ncbi:hypothetical protein [Brumimicrobium aurantiacum]|uniref:Uncharacterized protein n=1 Tax=Brumimicrobium aurantiacum TaxID=1737063 RepID=A0A3E1EZH7_9FLAO|nr:hypothetical protein [Brumimicrobium aurantiacum]RFC54971.1 hypothetical protein DXU93_03885 [Brumimicrobium aurantiacum]
MYSQLNGILKLSPHDIEEILGREGIGDNKDLKGKKWLGGEMRGDVRGNSTINDNFNLDGKVYTQRKANKRVKRFEKKKARKEKKD